MAYDFNKIAARYDRMNHLMTLGLDRRWRRRAATLLSRFSPVQTLDVACGTGDMLLELLRIGGCQPRGCDISSKMLAVAKTKLPDSVSLDTADVEQLPFPDASFDAVTCAFGVRNFVHLEQGLSEMARVLKPGGRMAVLELSTPDNPLVRPFYNLYAHHIIPRLGARLAGNREAYTYLPSSIRRFPKGPAMLQILSNQGLQPSQRKFFFGVCRLYLATK